MCAVVRCAHITKCITPSRHFIAHYASSVPSLFPAFSWCTPLNQPARHLLRRRHLLLLGQCLPQMDPTQLTRQADMAARTFFHRCSTVCTYASSALVDCRTSITDRISDKIEIQSFESGKKSHIYPVTCSLGPGGTGEARRGVTAEVPLLAQIACTALTPPSLAQTSRRNQ
jgi:hypothetical protein